MQNFVDENSVIDESIDIIATHLAKEFDDNIRGLIKDAGIIIEEKSDYEIIEELKGKNYELEERSRVNSKLSDFCVVDRNTGEVLASKTFKRIWGVL